MVSYDLRSKGRNIQKDESLAEYNYTRSNNKVRAKALRRISRNDELLTGAT